MVSLLQEAAATGRGQCSCVNLLAIDAAGCLGSQVSAEPSAIPFAIPSAIPSAVTPAVPSAGRSAGLSVGISTVAYSSSQVLQVVLLSKYHNDDGRSVYSDYGTQPA